MYSDYGYNVYNEAAATAFGFSMLSIMIVYISLISVAIAVGVIETIALWKVFKKAGRHGWEAIIPFYNTWTLFEISGYRGSIIFFGFIPYAGPIILLVFGIKAAISLAQKFHKSGGFAALLALVPVVGYCILGFGKDTYEGKLGVQRYPEEKTEEPKTKTNNFCGKCGSKVKKSDKNCPECGEKL